MRHYKLSERHQLIHERCVESEGLPKGNQKEIQVCLPWVQIKRGGRVYLLRRVSFRTRGIGRRMNRWVGVRILGSIVRFQF